MAIWPFFGLLWMLTKIVYFKACFGQIWANFKHFRNCKFQFSYFNKFIKGNVAFIWPFFIFQDLALFETAYGQIWPFSFFEPGNPALKFSCNELGKLIVSFETKKNLHFDWIPFCRLQLSTGKKLCSIEFTFDFEI